MSEQQRLIVAVALCGAIFITWNLLVPSAPPPPKSVVSGPSGAPSASGPSAPGAVDAVAGAENAPLVPDAPAAVMPESRELSTPWLKGTVSNQPLAWQKLELVEFKERDDPDQPGFVPGHVSLVPREAGAYQARVRWTGGASAASAMAFVDAPVGELRLQGRSPEGLETGWQIAPRQEGHAIDYRLTVTNGTGQALPAGASLELLLPVPESKGGIFSGPGVVVAGVCSSGSGLDRVDLGDLEDGPWAGPGPADWVGIDWQYFVVAAVAPQATARCQISATGRMLHVELVLDEAPLGPGETRTQPLTVYAGPKEHDRLVAVHPGFEEIIDYDAWGLPLGFIARPMIFLLEIFHGWAGSWGIAIILLTLTVKLLLFPITFKSAVGMRQMQLLKPELDKVKERFADDRERQQMEQLKLFKERGVNPLQGCLPMLLQMPVWLALYRSLWTAVDLYKQPFLWLPDLTAVEPGIPMLALALGVVFFGQQLLTPMTTDNQQAKIMRWVMPVMFTFFMLPLPSGLVLYIFVNSVLSVVQQLVINRVVGPSPAAAQVAAVKAEASKKPKTTKAIKAAK